MQTVSYTEARNSLAAAEYSAMEATLHLLSTPANAERIRQGLADYAAGKIAPGELCD